MTSIDAFVYKKGEALRVATSLTSEDIKLIEDRHRLEKELRKQKAIIEQNPWHSIEQWKAKLKAFWLAYEYEECREKLSQRAGKIADIYQGIVSDIRSATEKFSPEKGSQISKIANWVNPHAKLYDQFVQLESQTRVTMGAVEVVSNAITEAQIAQASAIATHDRNTKFDKVIHPIATGFNVASQMSVIEGLGDIKLGMLNLQHMASNLGISIDNTNWANVNASEVTATFALREALQTTNFKRLTNIATGLNFGALESLRYDLSIITDAAYKIQQAALEPISLYRFFESHRSSAISKVRSKFADQLLAYEGEDLASDVIYVPSSPMKSLESTYKSALRALNGDTQQCDYPKVKYKLRKFVTTLSIVFASAGACAVAYYYLEPDNQSDKIEQKVELAP